MAQRPLLRQILTSAWRTTILGAYLDRRINSERGLQVYFCSELLRLFPERGLKRTLLIEPRVNVPGARARYPDVLICNRDKVVAVVELKYGPRGKPSPSKDFTTLVSLSRAGQRVTISNDRYLGPARSRSYTVAADAVFCWAVVSRETSVPLPTRNAALLGSRLLHLQALAHAGTSPTVLSHAYRGDA